MLKRLLAYDHRLRQSLNPQPEELCVMIGVDEVGRGSAIGPVVAAAVSLPHTLRREEKKLLSALNDSKQLKPAIRKELSEAIHTLFRVGIGEASLEEVNTLNVYHASLLADWRAYQAWCGKEPTCDAMHESHYILIDGKALIPHFPSSRQKAIIKGDGLSACIAAASVVAKEYRDRMIIALAAEHPHYGWESNIGYLTPPHRRAIEQHGRTPYHRKNFLTKTEKQLALQLPGV
ncbi:MAG: ribonuclease HII [Vampirovibrionales bacterium]|nr:ribonuclease HII [Vampirovibrionales bacterium]